MKTLKKLSAALVLTFLLAIPAFAGEIEIPGSTPPPPPNSVIAQGGIDLPGATPPPPPDPMTTQGQIDIPGATADGTASSDSITSVAMSLLQDILFF